MATIKHFMISNEKVDALRIPHCKCPWREAVTGAEMHRVRGGLWRIGHRGFGKGMMKRFERRLKACDIDIEAVRIRSAKKHRPEPAVVETEPPTLTPRQIYKLARHDVIVQWFPSRRIEKLFINPLNGAVMAHRLLDPPYLAHPLSLYRETYTVRPIQRDENILVGDLLR